MKNSVPTNLEKLRISQGPMASDPSCGFNGAFIIPYCNVRLFVIVSDEMGWDHVSVSTAHRCPTWTEMCFVKRLFFDPEETVLQYHPAESQYINNHPNVLHLWRKQGTAVELPLIIMV